MYRVGWMPSVHFQILKRALKGFIIPRVLLKWLSKILIGCIWGKRALREGGGYMPYDYFCLLKSALF